MYSLKRYSLSLSCALFFVGVLFLLPGCSMFEKNGSESDFYEQMHGAIEQKCKAYLSSKYEWPVESIDIERSDTITYRRGWFGLERYSQVDWVCEAAVDGVKIYAISTGAQGDNWGDDFQIDIALELWRQYLESRFDISRTEEQDYSISSSMWNQDNALCSIPVKDLSVITPLIDEDEPDIVSVGTINEPGISFVADFAVKGDKADPKEIFAGIEDLLPPGRRNGNSLSVSIRVISHKDGEEETVKRMVFTASDTTDPRWIGWSNY